MVVDRVLLSDSQPPDVTVLVTVGQVGLVPLSVDIKCAMHGVLRSIPCVTEHDVLVANAIKVTHRFLAVAARLFVLESLSRSVVPAPLALIRARDPVLVPSGPNPSGVSS